MSETIIKNKDKRTTEISERIIRSVRSVYKQGHSYVVTLPKKSIDIKHYNDGKIPEELVCLADGVSIFAKPEREHIAREVLIEINKRLRQEEQENVAKKNYNSSLIGVCT